MGDEMPAASPEAVAEAFVAAVNSQHLAAAIDLLADDALFLPAAGSAVVGKEAIGQLLSGLTSSGTLIQIETSSTYVAGETAIRVGRLKLLIGGDAASTFELPSDYVTVYRRRADGWEIVIDAPSGFPKPLPQ